MRRGIILLALMSIVAACDSGGQSTSTTSSLPHPTTTTISEASSTTTTSITSTSVPESTTTSLSEVDVKIADGEVTGPDTFEVSLGDMVEIRILSDVDDEIHVHGYDLRFDLEAGVPFELSFVADVPGIFEVEAHNSGGSFEIEVTG